MSRTSISMGEVKKMLNYTIDNNIRLQEERGKMPIAVCLEAEAGIGKTSILQQIADLKARYGIEKHYLETVLELKP